ncbi:MAG: hypothetical protein OTJ44_03240 [Planctomycetota bacterium]|nr:hypothetical protein [Planctomycetota bacterium]
MSGALRRWIRIVGGSITGRTARNLSVEEAQEAFSMVLAMEGTDAQIAAFCMAMRAKGASADELSGFAKASRSRLVFPTLPEHGVVITTSRMGKFHSPPLGLGAAATASAAGACVLLQAAPSAEGAGTTVGDLCEELLGPLDADLEQTQKDLDTYQFACWQPALHDEGWKHLMRLEEEVGLRSIPDTVFKLNAPDGTRLLVPAMPGPVLGKAGDALAGLGHGNAVVIQGHEGSMDPFLCESTRGLLLEDGYKSPLRLEPMDVGIFSEQEPGQFHESRLEAAKFAMHKALAGADGPEMQTVVLGAAVLIRLAGLEKDLGSAVTRAREALESGEAQRRLNQVNRKAD